MNALRFLSLLSLALIPVRGDILVQYTFTGTAPTPADRTPTTEISPGIATDVSLTGLTEDTSRSDVFAVTNAATTPTDYYSFSIDAGLGNEFDFTQIGEGNNISFVASYLNGGSVLEQDYHRLDLSVDSGAFSTLATQAIPDDFNVSLTAYTGAQKLDFRIYVVRTAGWNDSSIDNLTVQGVVIPEPGTLALVGLALGSLLLFRRRK